MNLSIESTLPTWGCAGCGNLRNGECRRVEQDLPEHHATLAPKACPLEHAYDKPAARRPRPEYEQMALALA